MASAFGTRVYVVVALLEVRDVVLERDAPSLCGEWSNERFVRVVEVSTQVEDVDREGRTEGGKVYFETQRLWSYIHDERATGQRGI